MSTDDSDRLELGNAAEIFGRIRYTGVSDSIDRLCLCTSVLLAGLECMQMM